MASAPKLPTLPAGEGSSGGRGEDPDEALRALLPNVDEPTPVFFHSALVLLGPAAPHLIEAFDELLSMAVETARYGKTAPDGDVFQAEAEAVARDLAVVAGRAARMAHDGPDTPGSVRQTKICAVMADIALTLDPLRKSLEAASGSTRKSSRRSCT